MKYVPNNEAGFTLIEVLVAVAIFAAGMLGMLGLLANSLSWSYSANHTTIASMMAYQMADHVRGNVTQFAAYNDPTHTLTSNCMTTTGCTPTQMVESEASLWSQRLADKLPAGQGIICRDNSPTDGDPSNWACDDSAGAAPMMVKICWKRTLSGGAWSCYRVRV
jgi:type IV pilus assembly protein PilV